MIFVVLSVAGFLITLVPFAVRSEAPVAATMLLFFLQMFVAGGFVVFALSDGMAMLPKEHSAFLAGVCISAWALTTGLLMPVLGHLFDRSRYGMTFWVVACLPPAGTLLWHLLSKRRAGHYPDPIKG
jgi:predicted MFS family arabinose efflux permease